jgi:predicted MPP superfamily phosphohydrolase
MKVPPFSRRKFLAAILLAGAGVTTDARVEPTWLKVQPLNLTVDGQRPVHRFVQFTDVHHKGDRLYLKSVIDSINSVAPDFVCFTGDIMENGDFLDEALDLFSEIKAPLYGVPGNHDYSSGVSFEPIRECFAATGGAWLLDERRELVKNGSKINLIGLTCLQTCQPALPLDPSARNIALMHYPAWARRFPGQKLDLMLAGHSHGGQVRIPFYGAFILPYDVDGYDMGLFQTPSGPLYVNPGIGYIAHYDVRFNCRPEITVIEI